jgi:hypothetical protein
MDWPAWITATFTVVVAIATIVLAISTILLWKATKNAAERQDKTTRILQRAYISVEPAGIHPFNSRELIVGHVKFVNRGHLPARNVSNFTVITKGNDTLTEADLPIGIIREQRLVVAPQTNAPRGTKSIEVKKIAESEFLYVYGKVTYTDGFGVSRWIKFCHRYPWAMAEDVPRGKFIDAEYARYHDEGNDADENKSA